MNKTVFMARTHIACLEPKALLETISAGYAEHFTIEKFDNALIIPLRMGRASLTLDDNGIHVMAEAASDSDLSYAKFSIAEGIVYYAGAQALTFVWQGDGAAEGSVPPFFREMTVIAVSDVSPHMRRIRLSGEDLTRYESGGLHIRLVIPPKPPIKPRWPHLGADGRPVWPDGEYRLTTRVYTIRAINAAQGWVDIDMVVHPSASAAPGSQWASQAQVGDVIGMTGPGGGDVPEADIYTLIGDETALPAIGRILEQLPETATATVRIEVADASEEQIFATKAQLDVKWLHRDGAQAGTTSLLIEAVRDIAPVPQGEQRIFAWAGCEFNAFKEIRSFWRKDCGLTRDQHMAVAYWRRGVTQE